jgi:ribosomal protein S18 acetylase RimI-like enzyme
MTCQDATQQRAGLSDREIGEVRSLVRECRPVDVNIIQSASEGHQFLHYQDDELVGVLGLRHDGEACLCVAPTARRRGIGRALIAAADECLAQSGITEMVVESDANSREGKAFLEALLGTARNAEFRLRFSDPTALRATARTVCLERVGPEEIGAFMRASAASFGHPSEASYSEFDTQVSDARYRFYRARAGTSVVGGIRVTRYDTETHLTSFHTLPEARRRGHGRDLLLQTCQALLDDGVKEIILEVSTDNEAALGLYLSCGFEVVRRYDFYVRRVVAGAPARP